MRVAGEGTSAEEMEQQNQLEPPFLHVTKEGFQPTYRLLAMRNRHQPNHFREEKLGYPGERESSTPQPVLCRSILPSPGEKDVRGSRGTGAPPEPGRRKAALHLLGHRQTVRAPHKQTSPRPGPLALPHPLTSGGQAPRVGGVRPLLPMRAPTSALSRWKHRGAAASRAWPAAARGSRSPVASPGPREPATPRGSHSSPPRLATAPRRQSAVLRPPPLSTEARLCEGVAGGCHRRPTAAAEDGGRPGAPASSSLLVSQSDMAAPPSASAAHVAGLGAPEARGALIGQGGSLSKQ